MRALPFVDFVESVLGVTLTLGQRVLARVAFDRVEPRQLDGVEREMAARLVGPVDTVPSQARLVVAIVKGARIGGSYVFGALYSLWRALTADLSTLAPGEVAVALVVAPDLRLARQVLRYAQGAAESAPAIARLIASRTSDGFTLARPGAPVSIECLPATRGGSAVRGRSLVSAVLSEAAFFRDESSAVNDLDLFRAVMPRVMPGGVTVLESTPWVEAGLLFDLFSNFGEPLTALAAHAPTLVMRDDERSRLVVANETARDPINAEREFGAQFISGGSGLFFGPELLKSALVDTQPARSAPAGSSVYVGGDIGLVTDASAVAAVAEQDGVFTLCDFEEYRPTKGAPLKLSVVVQRFCDFAGRYGERSITVDHHELEAGREHLPDGFWLSPCAGGAAAKNARFVKARELLRQQQVRIPRALAKLTGQLSLVASRPLPGGGVSMVLPRRAGTHLDLTSAFILALDAASGNGAGNAFVRAMKAVENRDNHPLT